MSPATSVDSLEEDDPLTYGATALGAAAVIGRSVTDSGTDPAAAATEPLACVSCRARKLKCDRTKPACSRCVKVDGTCVYPESRRKPTVKRRNVKELEARLAQVEVYLKEVSKNDSAEVPEVEIDVDAAVDALIGADNESDSLQAPSASFNEFDFAGASASLNSEVPTVTGFNQSVPLPNLADIPNLNAADPTADASFLNDYQLMELGLSEGLPPMDVMEDLNRIYFAGKHFHLPIVHPGRYLQAFYGSALKKPPMCLQYAIWAQASHLTPKYGQYSEVFYLRARKYADADEMKGIGEHFITLSHAQAYAILASFEAQCMYFTRASLTTAKCVRLVNMMGLDKLDGDMDAIMPTLGPPTSWAELEERRRTFWGAYAIDSHASISAGWPSLIQCDDIATKLPSSEEAFIAGKEEKTTFLDEVMRGAPYAGFASAIVVCRTFKAIMMHCHRTKCRDEPEDLMNGKFWVRHRRLDNELTTLFMFLPDKLRLPDNVRDASALHINLNLHAAVICLHHAAIEQADLHGHDDSVKNASLSRLQATAGEVANIIRMTSHNTSLLKSPLCDLAMYCASTVYVYLARENEGLRSDHRDNLQVIIQAMSVIGRSHMTTQAFLQQACVDVERNNLAGDIRIPRLSRCNDVFAAAGGNCVTLMARIANMQRNSKGRGTLSAMVPPLKNPQDWPRLAYPNSTLGDMEVAVDPQDPVPCFRAMLGAVTRSVNPVHHRKGQKSTAAAAAATTHVDDETGGANHRQNQKRRRVSPSPGPENAPTATRTGNTGNAQSPSALSGGSGSSGSRYSHRHNHSHGHSRFPAQHANVAAVLPDRTSSSASSSPMNHVAGSTGTGTDTQTQSSQTSPGVFGFSGRGGLGGTPEENRLDLRSLQERVVATTATTSTIWDQEMLSGLGGGGGGVGVGVGSLPINYGGDPWGIMGADLDWDGQVTG